MPRRKTSGHQAGKSISLTILLVGLFVLGVVLIAANYSTPVTLTIGNFQISTISVGIVVLALDTLLAIATLRYQVRIGKNKYVPAVYDPPRFGQETTIICPKCGAKIDDLQPKCQNCGFTRPLF
jgi:energy-converting hydrogenase Eha subunit E